MKPEHHEAIAYLIDAKLELAKLYDLVTFYEKHIETLARNVKLDFQSSQKDLLTLKTFKGAIEKARNDVYSNLSNVGG